MKKITVYILFITLMLTGCNRTSESADEKQQEQVNNNSTDTNSNNQTNNESKTLVVYFTLPEQDGVDALAGASRVVENGELYGNVEIVANWISEELNANMLQIETIEAYPAKHEDIVNLAEQQKSDKARPELTININDLDSYDTIYLGYPNWWADLPMPLYSFLESYDLSGKTIIPFCVHGGSGFSNTIATIQTLQPNATIIQDGFLTSRNNVSNAKGDVLAWLAKNRN